MFALENVQESIRANLEGRVAHLEALMNVTAVVTSENEARRARLESYSHAASTNGADTHEGSNSASPMEAGDEAEHAAYALEVLAGGDGTKPLRDALPMPQHQSISLEEFAYHSIILREDPKPMKTIYARIPLSAPPSRRVHVESLMMLLGNLYVKLSVTSKSEALISACEVNGRNLFYKRTLRLSAFTLVVYYLTSSSWSTEASGNKLQ